MAGSFNLAPAVCYFVRAIQFSDETRKINRRGRRGSQRDESDFSLCDPLRPLRSVPTLIL